MREIDLIPREHVAERLLHRRLRWAGVGLVVLVGALIGVRLALQVAIAQERPAVDLLQRELRKTQALRSVRSELVTRQTELRAQVEALQNRRGPTGWPVAMRSIDKAFGPGLWLDQLNFTQSPALPAGTPAAPTEAASAPPAWHVQRRLEIRGHAMDHAGVMRFINTLAEQPALSGVRLVDSNLRRYAMTEVVDFTVSAQVDSTAVETSP